MNPQERTPSDRMSDAYAAIERQREEEDRRQHEEAVRTSHRRRLLNGLFRTETFVAGEGADRTQFARAWARQWVHASRLVRHYAGMETTRGLPLPTNPEFVIAQELFEGCLKGASSDTVAEELLVHLSKLAPDGKNWALRRFFEALRDKLVLHLDRRDGVLLASEPAPTHPQTRAPDSDAVGLTYSFVKQGEMWRVQYEGRTVFIKHRIGMLYIQRLLASPGRPVPVEKLVLQGGREAAPQEDEGDHEMAKPQEILDKETNEAVQAALQDLAEQITEAKQSGNVGRQESLQTEREQLLEILTRERRRDGSTRTFADPGEHLRFQVGRALETALQVIHKHDEVLEAHLRGSIRTPSGRNPVYAPNPEPIWLLGSA